MRAIDYFDKAADAYPDRAAIIDGDSRSSYEDARVLSERIAHAMWASGLEPEERAAIYSPNDARVLLCMLGLMRAGAAWVPINYRNAADANIEYMNYVETSWLFYHSSFQRQVDELKARVPTLRHLICIDAEEMTASSLHSFIKRGAQAQETEDRPKASKSQIWLGARCWKWLPTTGARRMWSLFVSTWRHFRMRQESSHLRCSRSARRTS
jgi:acyl-CoA synthetase (AMP-forming)/AMP-acid ligase II